MTTELILLLFLYAGIILHSLLGPQGPVKIFSTATPILASRIERNLATGYQFIDKENNSVVPFWQKPD